MSKKPPRVRDITRQMKHGERVRVMAGEPVLIGDFDGQWLMIPLAIADRIAAAVPEAKRRLAALTPPGATA